MADDTENESPPSAPPKSKAAAAREDRLAARLRENLRKRKEQARQRDPGA